MIPDSALEVPSKTLIGIATDALKDVIIELQGSLIKHLRHASEDDSMIDFSVLVDASDEGRVKAVNVLNDLYMRKAKTAHVLRNIPQGLPFTHLPSDNFNIRPQIVDGAQYPGFSPTAGSQIENNNTSKDSEVGKLPKNLSPPPSSSRPIERPNTSSSSAKRKFSGIFSHKPTFTTRDSQGGKPSDRDGGSDGSISPHEGGPNSNRSSAMTTTSPGLLDEDNPWVSELSGSPNETQRTSLQFGRVSQKKPYSVFRRQPTNESKLPSEDVYGGFCKGAYKLQVGLRDGLKLRNQSGSFQGEGYYWACGSSKCAFEGRAGKKDKEWAFDNTVRNSHGVRYRWTFLAKSHVGLSKAKNGIYDYRCVFCVSQGHESPVFRKAKVLIEHVSQHRGQHLDEAILRKTNCINLREAADDEDFDINLTPADSEVDPGQGVYWIPKDGVSSACFMNEDTMSVTNHWRD